MNPAHLLSVAVVGTAGVFTGLYLTDHPEAVPATPAATDNERTAVAFGEALTAPAAADPVAAVSQRQATAVAASEYVQVQRREVATAREALEKIMWSWEKVEAMSKDTAFDDRTRREVAGYRAEVMRMYREETQLLDQIESKLREFEEATSAGSPAPTEAEARWMTNEFLVLCLRFGQGSRELVEYLDRITPAVQRLTRR